MGPKRGKGRQSLCISRGLGGKEDEGSGVAREQEARVGHRVKAWLASQSPAALSWVQRKTGDRGQKGPTEV